MAEDAIVPAWSAPEGSPYRPSNGTEGGFFFEAWCMKCARDKSMSEGKDFDECDESETCPIIAQSFCGQVKEWVWGADGHPQCTAFIPAGDPIPVVRCDKTPDMFQEPRDG